MPTNINPLWRIIICSLNNITNIRLDINHAITEGRLIFDYLELFSCITNGVNIPDKYNKIEKGYEPLVALDISDFFEKNVFENVKIPESWEKAVNIKLNPEISLPSYSVCDHWELDFSLLNNFVKNIRSLYKE